MALINLRVCQEFHMYDTSITDRMILWCNDTKLYRVSLKDTHLTKENGCNFFCLCIFELCCISQQCALFIVLVLILIFWLQLHWKLHHTCLFPTQSWAPCWSSPPHCGMQSMITLQRTAMTGLAKMMSASPLRTRTFLIASSTGRKFLVVAPIIAFFDHIFVCAVAALLTLTVGKRCK